MKRYLLTAAALTLVIGIVQARDGGAAKGSASSGGPSTSGGSSGGSAGKSASPSSPSGGAGSAAKSTSSSGSGKTTIDPVKLPEFPKKVGGLDKAFGKFELHGAKSV